MATIAGIHHITAIASDPEANLDFYTRILGMRLVKKTVNFDDPGTYHFYYGDATGAPGSILTFFPWPGARRGLHGTGQLSVTAFAIPRASLEYWRRRIKEQGISSALPVERFDEEVLTIYDPDGKQIELVAGLDEPLRGAWRDSPVPPEHALLRFHGAALSLQGFERTARLLTETLGFRLTREHGNRFRFEAGEGGPGAIVDLLCNPDAPRGWMGAGIVHHIAWRTPDDRQQLEWRGVLAGRNYDVTPVMDRQYFHSIYFREPGGVLFEIATDAPGFMIDESPERLGGALMLPPWLEPLRPRLEQTLPSLTIPASVG